MLVVRGRAQLPHPPEHGPGPPAAAHLDQGLQGRPHRLRVGVVSVVDDRDTVAGDGDLHPPPAAGPGPGQRGRGALRREPQTDRDRRSGQRVRDVMRTDEIQRDRMAFTGGEQVEPCTPVVVDADAPRPYIGPRALAERDDLAAGLGRHRRDQRVVDVQDSGGGRGRGKLPLGPGDTGTPVGVLADVRRPDVQDDADLRPGQFAQCGDMAEAAGAHLQRDEPGGGLQAQQGQRQADLVVERTGRGDRGPEFTQQIGEKVLGGGLARRSGHGDHRCRRAVAHLGGERSERDRGVGDHDRRYADRPCRQHRGGAGPDRVRGEVVAVDPGTDHGDEQRAGTDLA